MATNNHSLSLTDEQVRLLDELSARTGKSQTELVSDALKEYSAIASKQDKPADQTDSLFERLSRCGLIGCLDGGRPDLSTNPEHMKGFGE